MRLFLPLLAFLALLALPLRAALNLNPEEQAWLKAHPVIRVGYDPNWPPFCFTNAQGQLDGLDRDALNLLEEILGIRFEIKNHSNWTAALAAGKNRDVDLLLSTGETEDRKKYLSFTKPYLYLPHVFVTKNNIASIISSNDIALKTVALPRDYTVTEQFSNYYPRAKIKLYASETDCLDAVSRGEVDLTVAQIATATHAIRTGKYWDIHFAGVYPEPTVFRYAVRDDWPEFVSILNQAVAAFDQDKRQDLYNKWVNQNIPQVFPWKKVIGLALAAALLAALVKAFHLHRNHLLTEQLRLRQELLEKIEAQSRQVSALSAAKTELLRTIAHDLRNPISAIMLNLDLAEMDSTLPDSLAEMRAQTRSMALLLDNTLTAQAIEDGAALYPITPIDIAALTHSTAQSYKNSAAQKKLRLEIDTSACPPAYPLNETAWRQILQNLLTNALKFSHPHGTIRLRLARQADTLLFTIQDNGPGLTASDATKIFTLYSQGSASPTRGEQSHGIGLTIVRELVTRLGGRITCENSTPGALFSIHFKAT